MGSLTATVPKPMLPLRGRRIIEHILTGFHAAGLREVLIVTGYLGEQIETHLGAGDQFGLRLSYRRQETAAGTARALLLAREVIGHQPFVLSWGDVVIEPQDYTGLIAEFSRLPCPALLAVNPIDDPWRGAAVYVDGNWRVTSLIEKPPRGASRTQWNNAGIFVFTPSIIDYAERLAPSARGEYELPQAIAAMIDDRVPVRAYPVRGFWSDLGTPDDLAAAERVFRSDGTVDDPSRRSQRKGPPQGERKYTFEENTKTVRPEEPPSFGGVSKPVPSSAEGGARSRKPILPRGEGD